MGLAGERDALGIWDIMNTRVKCYDNWYWSPGWKIAESLTIKNPNRKEGQNLPQPLWTFTSFGSGDTPYTIELGFRQQKHRMIIEGNSAFR